MKNIKLNPFWKEKDWFPDEYRNTIGKKILVINDVQHALQLAKSNKVVFLTSDDKVSTLFNKIVKDNSFFGKDDVIELIENWKDLNEIKTVLDKYDMFDLIVMNPPYAGNLHLKILEVVIPHAKKTINVSPARWLIDPLAKYKNNSDFKKYEQSIAQHIISIDLHDGNAVFDVAIGQVAVSEIDADIVSDIYKLMNVSMTFIDKIIQKCDRHKTFKSVATPEGYRGETKNFVGIVNSHFGDCTRWISDNYELFCEVRETNTNMDIFFDAEEERKNCFLFLTSKFMKGYAVAIRLNQRVPWQFVPFLNFKKAWTNKDLCNYFNITGYISDTEAVPGSEWEIILNNVNKK